MSQDRSRALRAPRARVGLSSASVYPEGTAVAFELAAKLGYDGVDTLELCPWALREGVILRRLDWLTGT